MQPSVVFPVCRFIRWHSNFINWIEIALDCNIGAYGPSRAYASWLLTYPLASGKRPLANLLPFDRHITQILARMAPGQILHNIALSLSSLMETSLSDAHTLSGSLHLYSSLYL